MIIIIVFFFNDQFLSHISNRDPAVLSINLIDSNLLKVFFTKTNKFCSEFKTLFPMHYLLIDNSLIIFTSDRYQQSREFRTESPTS